MNHLFNKTIGYFFIYAWCIVSAFSMIFTGGVSQQLGPFVVCFFTFLFVKVIFLTYNIKRLKDLKKIIVDQGLFKLVTGLNVSSFVGWGLLIYPLSILEPTLVATLVLGVNPIATVVLTALFLKTQQPKSLVYISVLLFVVILFLLYRAIGGDNVLPSDNTSLIDTLSALLCCILAGFATSGNNIFSKKLMTHGLTAIDLMCTRFYFTIVLSGFICLFIDFSLNLQDLTSLLWTSILFVILPLMLLQLSLKKLDPLRIAVISPAMPVIVIFMQLYMETASLSTSTLISTILIWVLMLTGSYFSMKTANK